MAQQTANVGGGGSTRTGAAWPGSAVVSTARRVIRCSSREGEVSRSRSLAVLPLDGRWTPMLIHVSGGHRRGYTESRWRRRAQRPT